MRRAAKPDHAVLTRQRTRVLGLLDEYTYLRTKHFYELLPNEGSATNETWERGIRRCLQLAEGVGLLTHEEVHERLPNSRSGFNHSESIYYRYGKRSPHSLNHDIAITEFHLALKRAVGKFGVQLFWRQVDLRRGGLNPDAFFALHPGSERAKHWFFLEVETSRQGHYRRNENSALVQKLRAYDDLTSDQVAKDWNFDDFRVIVLVKNAARAVNLIRKLSAVLPYRFIWIGANDSVLRHGACSGVFFTPSDYHQASYSLLDVCEPRDPVHDRGLAVALAEDHGCF
jgi:hypothetical protein